MRWNIVVAFVLFALPAFAQEAEQAEGAAEKIEEPAKSTEAVLDEARSLYAALEYDRVLPLANEVLTRDDVTIDQRADAYVLQGSALAIVGDNIEAEKSFRLVLQMRPDFDLPADTSPRILSILRKVQAEVKEMRAQARRQQLSKIVDGLALKSEHPTAHEGGLPLAFAYRFTDPTGAVDSVRVQYRKAGGGAFASLPLERDDQGTWSGKVPGDYTANEGGLVVEFYVDTRSSENDKLLQAGDEASPLRIDVAPGSADRAPPPPLEPWTVWTGVGVTAAIGVAAAATGVSTLMLELESEALYAAGTLDDPADGAFLQSQERTGEALALTTNILLGAAGATALATLVAVPFTNWSGAE
jgi:hypothetical protein